MLRRVLLAALLTVSGLAIIAMTAPPAAADSCSDCGESQTTLGFYHADGNGEIPNGGSFPYGQTLLMDAIVLDVSGSCDIGDCNNPSGHVYFYDNGAANPFLASSSDPNNYTPTSSVSNNVSSWSATVSSLAVGSHSIRALYHSGFFSVSNPHKFDDSEDTKTIVITKAPTSNTLASNMSSSSYGSNVTFTATIAPNPAVAADVFKPTGNVQLVDVTDGGNTILATQAIDASGVATFNVTNLPAGTRTISSAYVGDGNYEAHGSNNLTQTVTKATPSLALSTSPSPSTFGQSVTLTASLTPNTATGTVAFTIDGNPAGTATVSGGSASVTSSSMAAGSHSITASYSGDGNFNTALNYATHVVQKVNTTSSLQSSPNPTVYGQSVGLSGSITPATATGSVTFYDGSNSIGTGTAPTPSLSTSALSVGSHSLTFVYGGDSNHYGSTSNTVTQVVNKANTSIALTGPSGAVDFGSNVPISATVSAVAPGAGTPTGTLTLYDGTINLGTATLSGGHASFSVPNMLPGSHTITAVYSGDGNFNGSTSSTPLAITLTCQNNVTGPSVGTVTASGGSSTCIYANVSTLIIPEGARVFVSGAQIRTVSSRGADRIAICGSTLLGSVSITEATGPVMLGNVPAGCAGNTFKGSTSLTYNHGPVVVADNTMIGLTASYNKGGVTIANNQFSGTVSCQSNIPAPTNGGRPNQGGGRSGQCVGL